MNKTETEVEYDYFGCDINTNVVINIPVMGYAQTVVSVPKNMRDKSKEEILKYIIANNILENDFNRFPDNFQCCKIIQDELKSNDIVQII